MWKEIQIKKEKDLKNLEALLFLEKECFGEEAWSRSLLQGELENSYSLCFLAKKGKEVVGYLLGRMVIDEGEILRIAVKDHLRNRGIGSSLLKAYLSELKKRKVKKVFLEVSEKNERAIRFYEKFGFKPLGLRKNYYLNNTQAIVMGIKFKQEGGL